MKEVFTPEVLAGHTAILGMTGSGKTSTAKLLVEQVFHEDYRVCILDPSKSDWWGITSSRDGKKPGLPFDILGGPHGHVPLHSGAGKAIGELVGTGKLRHSIIDMADFEPGGVSRFFNDFAQSLWKHTKGVLYLVWEEAHEFAPKERSGVGAENMSVYYAKKIATGARSKGLRLVACDQRVQQLHNSVLGSCKTVIAQRFIAPADQDPVMGWVKGAIKDKALVAEIANSLADLKDGEGFQISGRDVVRRQFPRINTFDNSAAPTSDDELKVVQASIDTTQLRAIIGTAVQEAEASDPAKLREEIQRLKGQLATKLRDSAPTESIEIARRAGHLDGLRKGRDMRIEELQAAFKSLEWNMSNLKDSIAQLNPIVKGSPWSERDPSRTEPPLSITLPKERQTGNHGTLTVLDDYVPMPKPPGGKKLDMLRALAQFGSMSARRMGILIDMSVGSGTWKNYIADLKKAGLIDGGSEQFNITTGGVIAAGKFDPLPSGERLLDYWENRLGGKKRSMFAEIRRTHPLGVSSAALGARIGMQVGSGTWKNYLGELRALGLVAGKHESLILSSELLE